MNKTTEALKMTEEAANRVIETLEYLKTIGIHPDSLAPAIRAEKKALTAIREALAEQDKQEPVAVISESAIGLVKLHSNGACLPFGTQLYAAPVSAEPCKECDAKQAKIDSLMLEYCPDEITDEQMTEWSANQKPVSECRHCGWLCMPNDSHSKKWYPMQEPVKQEPVALSFPRDTTSWTGGWTIDYKLVRSVDDAIDDNEFKPCLESVEQVLLALEKVYAAPVSAKREWVDLTDDEIDLIEQQVYCRTTQKGRPLGVYAVELIRALIAAFKEKNK